MKENEESDSLKVFDLIYEECEKILVDNSVESLNKLNEYAKTFIDEENRGKLRTIIIYLKPLMGQNEEIRKTVSIIAKKLQNR